MARSPVLTSLVALALLLPTGPSSAALPTSAKAPAVGDEAPDFVLPAADGTTTHLGDLVRRSEGGTRRWLLLVFYRGYW